jgi:hypothetical protein
MFAAVLAGCAHAPEPSQITRIVLSRTECNGMCTFAQYTITQDRRVSYSNGMRFTWSGRLDPKTYSDLVTYLTQVPAFGPKTDYLTSPSQEPSTYIWTEFNATHRQVRFPTDATGGDEHKLASWARFASAVAGGAVMRARRPFVDRLSDTNRLERVAFTSRGCFGRCPAYIATFYRDGRATIRNAVFAGTARNADAGVPFSRVTDLLNASAFAYLQPEYPTRVVDVYGVSFEFDYRDGLRYTVDAPDRTQWPPPVAQLTGAFQQLVRDTDWKPGAALAAMPARRVRRP